MKLHLDKIETQVKEQLLIEAEELLMADALPVKELEKNLWVGKFEDNEVEVKTYGRKISSFTCECKTYFESKICKHSVAAFFKIRKQKPTPTARKARAKSKPEPIKRLTVSTILNNVKDEELVRFLGLYARKDQQFTNFLKTKFATRVELPSTRDKYANLLATVIRSNQSSNLSFSRSGAKKIHDLLNILIEEIEDEFRGENYLEVFEACRCIIEKVTPVLSRLTAHRGDLVSTLEKTYLMLINMLKETISPALKTSISEFFILVIRQRYFNYRKLDKLALTAYKSLITSKVSEKILFDCLSEETEKRYHNRELEAKIFHYYFLILEKRKDRNKRLADKLENRPWLLWNSVNLAKKVGHFSVVKWLSDFGLENKKYKSIYSDLDDLRLQIALEEEQKDDISLFAAKQILNTHNPKYFIHFKNQFEPGAPEIQSLFERINYMEDSKKKNSLLAELYLMEGLFEKLFLLLEDSKDLAVLTEHANVLYNNNKQRTQALTWEMIGNYLETHIGEPSVRGTQNIIRNLYKADASALAKWATQKIRQEYKSRKSLMQELIMFR